MFSPQTRALSEVQNVGSHGSDVMKDHDADWVIAVAASFFDSGELGQFFSACYGLSVCIRK